MFDIHLLIEFEYKDSLFMLRGLGSRFGQIEVPVTLLLNKLQWLLKNFEELQCRLQQKQLFASPYSQVSMESEQTTSRL